MTPADEIDIPSAPNLILTLPAAIWQRRWLLIVPLILASVIGVAVAMLMPPMYESDGTVLIESPQLPADLVSSPVTDIVDQRIARTRERVLSRSDLIRLIRANDLYPREQRTMAFSRIVDKMKDDTVLQAVGADLQSARGTHTGAPDTIAITIGFRYSDPAKAQAAAHQQQIAMLRGARSTLLSQGSASRNAQNQAPALAAQVDQLEKQADGLRDQYRALGGKLQTAQVSARMQTEQKGERLVLADPPIVPDRPFKPNRPIIIAGAVAAGGGIGLALILLVELLLRPLRGTEAVTYAVGVAPLVVIPDFNHRPNPIVRFIEARRRRRVASA